MIRKQWILAVPVLLATMGLHPKAFAAGETLSTEISLDASWSLDASGPGSVLLGVEVQGSKSDASPESLTIDILRDGRPFKRFRAKAELDASAKQMLRARFPITSGTHNYLVKLGGPASWQATVVAKARTGSISESPPAEAANPPDASNDGATDTGNEAATGNAAEEAEPEEKAQQPAPSPRRRPANHSAGSAVWLAYAGAGFPTAEEHLDPAPSAMLEIRVPASSRVDAGVSLGWRRIIGDLLRSEMNGRVMPEWSATIETFPVEAVARWSVLQLSSGTRMSLGAGFGIEVAHSQYEESGPRPMVVSETRASLAGHAQLAIDQPIGAGLLSLVGRYDVSNHPFDSHNLHRLEAAEVLLGYGHTF